MCPVKFKRHEAKVRICANILYEVKAYKHEFIDKVTAPLSVLLFGVKDYEQELKDIMCKIYDEYFCIYPASFGIRYSKDFWEDIVIQILCDIRFIVYQIT